MERVHLKRTSRLLQGHLWIFSNELHESPKRYIPGSLVSVHDMRDRFIGTGYINPHSLIAVRLLTREEEEIDRTFFMKRIRAAIRMREKILRRTDAVRLVFSEGDLVPGLIADRYGGCLVVQFLTMGIESFRDVILDVLDEAVRPSVIVIRNDSKVRLLESVPLGKEVAKGALGSLPVIEEEGVSFEVDPLEGQKTGFFLDQRDNRIEFRKMVRGGRGLDLFCYQGAWTLHLCRAGLDMTGVDSSGRALEQAARNAGLNGLRDKARFVQDDVFSFLDAELARGGEGYDVVVCDPPAFVKSSTRVREAVKAYRDLNEKAMRLLKPGGLLATSSCSYHLSREIFTDMLRSAARQAGRSPRLLAMRSQALDHPVLLAMPETEYLKCAFLILA